MTRWVICLSVLLGVTCDACFADSETDAWSQFRGPTGQGIASAKGLPIEWDTGKNIVWKCAIPGLGWSSPVYRAGRIYLTTAVPQGDGEKPDHSLRALCIDAAKGETLWNSQVFVQDGEAAPRIHGKNSHASPTPVVDEQHVYVHFGHQGMACLDLAGNVVWKNSDIRYAPVHGNGGSPILVNGKLIFSTDGARQQLVTALDCKTGRIVWQAHRNTEAVKKFSFSTPSVVKVDGRQQVVSPGSDAVCAYDVETGEEIWRVRYTGYSVIPRPVYGHGLVFMSTGYDSPEVLAIRPDGQGDVTDTHIVWRMKKGAPHTPSLLLQGDELYMVSDRGIATCVDAPTGEVRWTERIGGNYSASPLYADGRIYFQNEQGECTVIAAGRDFKELARNTLDERTFASYAVAEGALFVRTETQLYRIQDRP